MDLKEFIENFAAEFDETPEVAFAPETDYKSLDEWNSLTALSIIAMVDDSYNNTINILIIYSSSKYLFKIFSIY